MAACLRARSEQARTQHQKENKSNKKTKTLADPNHLTPQKVKVASVPSPASGPELIRISHSPTANKAVVGLELVTPPMREVPCVNKVKNRGCCLSHSPPGCGLFNRHSWSSLWQRHEACSSVGLSQSELGEPIGMGLLLLGFPALPHVLTSPVKGRERCQSHHPPHPMVDARWGLQ